LVRLAQRIATHLAWVNTVGGMGISNLIGDSSRRFEDIRRGYADILSAAGFAGELAPGNWTDCLTRVLISPTGERTDKQ